MFRVAGLAAPDGSGLSRSSRLAGTLVLATITACSKLAPMGQSGMGDAKPTASSQPAIEERPVDSENGPVATMRLLDAGRAPRRKLRYAWHERQGEALTMELRTSASTSTEEGANRQPEILLPPVRIVVAIDPKDASPDGDLTYAWHVTAAAVTANSQTPSSLAAGMRGEVAAIERLSGTGVVTSCGLAKQVSIDSLPVMDGGATGQMVEQIRQTLRDVAAPFPDEDVGLGARWEKLSRLASRDARVTQTETFELADLAGQTGTLDDRLAQTAPPQPLLAPGSAAGAPQANMESMLASGEGKTRFDLSRLVPRTNFDGTTTMVVSSRPSALPQGGPPQNADARRVTMIMRVGIVLAGSLR